MLPPDRLADLLPQEARTHPERPDFPSVAVLMPDRICRAAGSRWKGRRHGRPLRCCIAKGWPFCRGLARSQSATRLRLGWPAPVGRSASVTSGVRGCGLKARPKRIEYPGSRTGLIYGFLALDTARAPHWGGSRKRSSSYSSIYETGSSRIERPRALRTCRGFCELWVTLLMRSVMVSFRKINLCFSGFFISVRSVR